MQTPLHQTWQDKAAAKVARTKAKIPDEWTLQKDDLIAAKKQRQLSGPFIERFLNNDELEITNLDTVPLLSQIESGHYTAIRVTKAFCKRTAIAQQIVG
jgi:amidase